MRATLQNSLIEKLRCHQLPIDRVETVDDLKVTFEVLRVHHHNDHIQNGLCHRVDIRIRQIVLLWNRSLHIIQSFLLYPTMKDAHESLEELVDHVVVSSRVGGIDGEVDVLDEAFEMGERRVGTADGIGADGCELVETVALGVIADGDLSVSNCQHERTHELRVQSVVQRTHVHGFRRFLY